MNLENSLEISLINEFYGNLLTEKQKDMIIDYFDNNMSLAEIAENHNISRQAVRDSLVKSQKLLYEFEAKLGFKHKYSTLKNAIFELTQKDLTKDEYDKELKNLLNLWEVS